VTQLHTLSRGLVQSIDDSVIVKGIRGVREFFQNQFLSFRLDCKMFIITIFFSENRTGIVFS
jgi:hypothetical protein